MRPDTIRKNIEAILSKLNRGDAVGLIDRLLAVLSSAKFHNLQNERELLELLRAVSSAELFTAEQRAEFAKLRASLEHWAREAQHSIPIGNKRIMPVPPREHDTKLEVILGQNDNGLDIFEPCTQILVELAAGLHSARSEHDVFGALLDISNAESTLKPHAQAEIPPDLWEDSVAGSIKIITEVIRKSIEFKETSGFNVASEDRLACEFLVMEEIEQELLSEAVIRDVVLMGAFFKCKLANRHPTSP